MVSTLQLTSGLPKIVLASAAARADFLAQLPGLQTDLILAATLLFLLLATWGMLMTARSGHAKVRASQREQSPAVGAASPQLAELPRDR